MLYCHLVGNCCSFACCSSIIPSLLSINQCMIRFTGDIECAECSVRERKRSFPRVAYHRSAGLLSPTGCCSSMLATHSSTKKVQTVVNFVRKHNLCVCVAGSGHDFLNRHSCHNETGMFIRTGLLKGTYTLRESVSLNILSRGIRYKDTIWMNIY